ncbi:CsbD family protein [Iodobacter fluviatilis]|uniref:General stress protein CsbD n=1 Tax=Iodobacter fluviatilis TaxID=537 RepID=A0A7G3G7V5_9NEIS|nr:CsbD family protein [Iodobacter fluviatilis]QBC43198.1 general stress protein CsbD [Iodobacter fluviatilis]
MNWDIAEGNWKEFKGKVKEQWGNLTDDHLDVIAGKRDRLAGQIQKAYGITKDEAELQITKFEKLNKDAPPKHLP